MMDQGRRALMVLFGSFCAMMCTFGATTASGVFQAYYEKILPSQTAATIAWISALQYFFLFFLSYPCSVLQERGYARLLLYIGGILTSVSQLSLSWCTSYWKLLFVQGILNGLGSGMVFSPACALVPPHFTTNKNMAMGIVATGSAAGGVVYSVLSSSLLERLGFAWTCRVLALVTAVLMGCACFCIRPADETTSTTTNDSGTPSDSIESPPSTLPEKGRSMDRILTISAYAVYVLGTFLAACAVYLPLSYVDAYVQALGLRSSSLQYLVAIINASSIPGRIVAGLLADRIGPIVTIIPGTAICGILCFVWTRCDQVTTLLIFSIFYGFAQGIYVSLLPTGVILIQSFKLATSLGILFSLLSIALLTAPPIFGLLIDENLPPDQAYNRAAIYAGCILLGGTVVLAISQCLWWWKLRKLQVDSSIDEEVFVEKVPIKQEGALDVTT